MIKRNCCLTSSRFPTFAYLTWIPIFLAGAVPDTEGETIYVDSSLSADCTNAYHPDTRSCGDGSATAYHSFSDGLAGVAAGDTLLLREGNYSTLLINRSGSPGSPITIQVYTGETATVSGGGAALDVEDQSYITVDGLTVQSVGGFARVYHSDHIILKNCSFNSSSSSGTSGAAKFHQSTYCKVLGCIFDNSGSDILILQDASDHNLIEGNTFGSALHSEISIRCSEFNIIRSNILNNPEQKCIELYDCEGVSDAPVRLDSTAHNLIEGNFFINTKSSDMPHRYNGIQHAAQFSVVRHNVFRNCLGGAVNYQEYSDEALYVYGNRMYNNTFYENRCYAIIGQSGPSSRFHDNRVKNNLLYRNSGCDGSGGQTYIEDPGAVILSNNTLAVSDPGFVNEGGHDFRLLGTSDQVDAGVFVSSAIGVGSGTVLSVEDATYFCDGFDIAGELGDLIQLEGQSVKARVVQTDYTAHTLSVDRSLTWTQGQGVHLVYAGSAPDVGAFEHVMEEQPMSPPPTNLRRIE